MTTFKPAVRENVGLWINLIGGTGGGKTFTAMELATGICGLDTPFAVIDTENGRAKHYAPPEGEKADGKLTFNFHHAPLAPPFRPSAYQEAIVDADKAGYPVIVVDSGSHVWAGDGGVLDWQDDELADMVKRAASRNDKRPEWQIREAGKMSAWIKPKMGHKQMVQKMLQARAHIILCLRAEEKIEMVKDKDGKTVIQKKVSLTGKDGWIPICDKNLPFEATCSFLLLASAPGMPHPIKLQEQHKSIFPLDRPIDAEAGRRLAAWASGAPKTAPPAEKSESASLPVTDAGGAAPTTDEALLIKAGEFAECGTERYAAWWQSLTAEQRKAIGTARHQDFKSVAAKVPA